MTMLGWLKRIELIYKPKFADDSTVYVNVEGNRLEDGPIR